MSKICPKCGNIEEDDSLFCDKCGQKLDEVPVTPEEKPEPEKVEPEKVEKAEPVKKEPKKVEKVEPEKKEEKKSNKGLIIGLVALLLIGVVAGVLLLGGKKTVTFDVDGGTPVAAVKLKKGEKIAKPADPAKEGYDFMGWYLGDKQYNFDLPVDDNITLKAHWDTSKFVTFMAEGKEIAKEHVVDGHVKFPEAPAMEGYAFVGWQDKATMAEIGEDFVFTGDMTLEANYKVFVPISSIGFEKKTYYIWAGDTVTPKLTIKPSDWVESIGFTSSDESIATVTPEGIVTGVGAGSVTIKVASESGKTAECTVVVATVTVDDPFTLGAGEKKDLGVKIEPKEAASKLTYKSTDGIVARVDKNGKVTGIEGGKCQIKITTDTGLSKTITVYVDEYTRLLDLDWNKTENAGYLFYRQNDRPIVSIKEFELRTTTNGKDKFTERKNSEIKNIKMVGGDKVLYWNADDNELYATSYGQVSNGFTRVKEYEVYFTYVYDGKTYKTGIYNITVEPTLECEVQGDITKYDDVHDTITLSPGEGTKYFTIRVNQDCDHAVSSNLIILGVTHPKPEKGKPAYSIFSCKYTKSSSSSAAWITFLTDGGQRLDIDPIE